MLLIKHLFLLIVSGPVFFKKNPRTIGAGKVCVPDALFKVFYDPQGKGGDDWFYHP